MHALLTPETVLQEEILEQIRQEAREREIAKLCHSSVAEEEDVNLDTDDIPPAEDAFAPSEDMKRITPEADVSLDDSLTDKEGRKTIHVVRDRELYASALQNEGVEDVDEETTLQASDFSHPLLDMDNSRTEEAPRHKVSIPASGASSAEEEQHRYESFAEASDLDDAEKEEEVKSKQGGKSASKASVARSVSAASDVSAAGSLRGVSNFRFFYIYFIPLFSD